MLMKTSKEKMALRHYRRLKRQFSHLAVLDMDNTFLPKETFIKEFPLSILGFVSVGAFWRICRKLNIVQHRFYAKKEKFSPFEQQLHDICIRYRNSENKLSELKHCKNDIQKLFETYNIQ